MSDLPDDLRAELQSLWAEKVAAQAVHRLEDALAAIDRMLDIVSEEGKSAGGVLTVQQMLISIERGTALQDLGRLEAALESYAVAGGLLSESPALAGRAEHDPTRARLAMNRGSALQRLGRLEAALEAYGVAEALLSKSPALAGRAEHDATRARLATNRGNALQDLGRLEAALEAYGVAEALLSESPALAGGVESVAAITDLLLAKAEALHRLGNYAAARRNLEAAEAFSSENAELSKRSGHMLIHSAIQLKKRMLVEDYNEISADVETKMEASIKEFFRTRRNLKARDGSN